ncbi:MAG: polyprenyl synthetase family protein [Ruminococcaceae bacterium]|nr:polyprenyl synthetase family protein [Oscillospiraceae bacterium]
MTEQLIKALRQNSAAVETHLAALLSGNDPDYGRIQEAERYSVLGGGKRIRPFLVVEFCRLFGGTAEAALPFAAAIEMMHCFSLIHDDLPCMDDDNLRRGKPTNHVVYGEALALLAGDSLSIRALETAANNAQVDPAIALAAVKLLARSAGTDGMIGGQVIDMWGEEHPMTMEQLRKLQACKTGALIRAAALLGCLAAGVPEEDDRAAAASAYAENIGLAFQIVDDILDCIGNEALLGKPIGSDAEQGKTTFMHFMSVAEAQAYAAELTAKAKAAIAAYSGSEILLDLADYLLERQS